MTVLMLSAWWPQADSYFRASALFYQVEPFTMAGIDAMISSCG